MEDARVEVNATSGSTDNPRTPGSSTKKRINIYKENEELAEISKKRLGSYIDANDKESKKDSTYGGDGHKAKKRLNGLLNAFNKKRGASKVKATNESEDIQEVSKKRLGNYMDAARDRIKTRSGESSQQQKNIDKAAHGMDRARHNYERSNHNAAAYQAATKKEKIDAEIIKRKQGIMKAAKKFNKKKTGE